MNIHDTRFPATLAQLEQRDDFVGRHVGPDAAETRAMLDVLGLDSLDQLIDKVIPAAEACLASTALNPGCGQAVPAEVNGVQVRDNTVKRTMDAENRAKLANVTPEPGSSVPTIISAWDMGYFDVEAECNDGGSWGACTYTGEGTSFGTASIDVTDLELKVQWGS